MPSAPAAPLRRNGPWPPSPGGPAAIHYGVTLHGEVVRSRMMKALSARHPMHDPQPSPEYTRARDALEFRRGGSWIGNVYDLVEIYQRRLYMHDYFVSPAAASACSGPRTPLATSQQTWSRNKPDDHLAPRPVPRGILARRHDCRRILSIPGSCRHGTAATVPSHLARSMSALRAESFAALEVPPVPIQTSCTGSHSAAGHSLFRDLVTK